MSNFIIHRNLQQGIDLSFTDKNSTVKVDTGSREDSLEFWKSLKATADQVINDLSRKPQKVHVVMINDGKIRRKSY